MAVISDQLAEEIYTNLSRAQKRALLGIPVMRPFRPKQTGYQWPSLSQLKAKRLIRAVEGGMPGMGPAALHVISDRGRAVRAWAEKRLVLEDANGQGI